jgi:hypothetical protein
VDRDPLPALVIGSHDDSPKELISVIAARMSAVR